MTYTCKRHNYFGIFKQCPECNKEWLKMIKEPCLMKDETIIADIKYNLTK